MLEIAGGVVLAVIFLVLLPVLLRLAVGLLGLAALFAGIVLGIYVFAAGVAGAYFVVTHWETVATDATFWLILAGCIGFWVWVVFVAKPDWLQG